MLTRLVRILFPLPEKPDANSSGKDKREGNREERREVKITKGKVSFPTRIECHMIRMEKINRILAANCFHLYHPETSFLVSPPPPSPLLPLSHFYRDNLHIQQLVLGVFSFSSKETPKRLSLEIIPQSQAVLCSSPYISKENL